MGLALQHTSTFLTGFIVAFTKGWDMTLVMVGCLPFLALAGMALAKLMARTSKKQNAAYTEAGAIVQQSLSQIRTVTAYNGQDTASQAYSRRLEEPQRVCAVLCCAVVLLCCCFAVLFICCAVLCCPSTCCSMPLLPVCLHSFLPAQLSPPHLACCCRSDHTRAHLLALL